MVLAALLARLRARLHVHWAYGHTTLGVFVHGRCRCGLVRSVWLERGQPVWSSTWGTVPEVNQQLKTWMRETALPDRSRT